MTAILFYHNQEGIQIFRLEGPTSEELEILNTVDGITVNIDDLNEEQNKASNHVLVAMYHKTKEDYTKTLHSEDEMHSVPKRWFSRWNKNEIAQGEKIEINGNCRIFTYGFCL